VPNFFDQFDATPAPAGGNVFDQFDLPASGGLTVAPKGGSPRSFAPVRTGQVPIAGREGMAGFRIGDPSFGQAFGRAALERFINNLLAVPSVLRDAQKVNPITDVQNILAGQAPKQVLGSTPRVTLSDIRAALDTAGQVPDMVSAGELNPVERFRAAQQQQEQAEAARRAQAPFATGAGEVAGDVATLITGRAPISRALTAAPKLKQIGTAGEIFINAAKKLGRGAGRAAEVGLEGAVLATLNGGDPAKTAALAAGGQAFGSLALTLGRVPFKGKGLGALAAIGAGTAAIQLFKALTPGGRDRILESAESAAEHVGYEMLVGGLAAIMGAGRVRGSDLSKSFPVVADKIADAISTGLRGPWISLWKDWTKESDKGVNRIEPVLNALAEAPETFTATERNQLKRALTTGEVSISSVLDRLSRKRSFRGKIGALISGDPL
jgi:hypothetical protein